jgi:predicted nucleotidyltransferase
MSSILQTLQKQNLGHPPKWLVDNTMYETLMGSVAYGVSSDTSDNDVYGFGIPPKNMVFPHLTGYIQGFGTKPPAFEQYSEHHMVDESSGKNWDVNIYNIVKYFQLCMENNPNMIDSLFTPVNCIIHCTHVGQMVRDNRKMFLHKGSYHKFRGYAFTQLHKMKTKTPIPGSKRALDIEKNQFDTKYAYHLVRLADEAEQILTTGDLDLQRSKEYMKAVRKGEVTEQDIRNWFTEKERHLESLYQSSKIPHSPDEEKIKTLLLECFEAHYGNLDKCVVLPNLAENTLEEIGIIIDRYQKVLNKGQQPCPHPVVE